MCISMEILGLLAEQMQKININLYIVILSDAVTPHFQSSMH